MENTGFLEVDQKMPDLELGETDEKWKKIFEELKYKVCVIYL